MAPSAIAEHAVEEVQNKVVVPKPIERIPLPKLEAKGKARPLEDHGEIQPAFPFSTAVLLDAHRRNQRSATGAGKRRWCRGWRPGRRAGRPDGWSDWRCAWWSIEHGSQAGGGALTSKIRSDPSWWPCESPPSDFSSATGIPASGAAGPN